MIPAYEKTYPWFNIKVIAVGSGEALKLGEKKDADVLLVHSPAAERAFVLNGFGKNRKDVMYNDYVIVGPARDPAGVQSASDAVAAMKKINTAGTAGNAKFISRGDNSGTHSKEKALWVLAGSPTPTPSTWYISAGLGMGETLRMADEMEAYTIVDRATWLANKPAGLSIRFEGDPNLYNQYGVIEVVGAKQPGGRQELLRLDHRCGGTVAHPRIRQGRSTDGRCSSRTPSRGRDRIPGAGDSDPPPPGIRVSPRDRTRPPARMRG